MLPMIVMGFLLGVRKSGFRYIRQFFNFLSFFTLGLIIGIGLWSYLLAGDIYDYEDTVNLENLPKVDAIVCLGGGRGRIAAAGNLWHHYVEKEGRTQTLPTLYFSGMGRQANWNSLSKQIKHGIAQKISMENVVIEKESLNTDANARWLARYVEDHHWKRILLLTSTYHMKRARFIFEHVFRASKNPVEIETLSVYQEPFAAREWRKDAHGIRVTLTEYLKWVYYRAIWSALE